MSAGHPVTDELIIDRHGAAGALRLQDELLTVYNASHADVTHIPFMSPERFRERLVELYAPIPGFELVTGRLGTELVGYAFGSPRWESASTWAQIHAALPDFPVPAGTEPIYIFREFAVRPDRQYRGYGRRLHDALLGSRPESLAHLLVRQDNVRARSAYLSWNWQLAGTVHPFPDAPIFDAMIRELPLTPR
jgi:GNAT superfamily N-acetyltransferase